MTRWAGDREEQVLFTACAIAAIVPLWTVRYLPMTDVPQHVAQISIWQHMNDPGYGFAEQFELNWFTPYLFGYCVARVLAAVFGAALAVKLVITLALLGLGFTYRILLDAVRGDRSWAPLALAAFYGYSFYWGFVNFIFALPLALLFMAFAFRYARSPSRRGAIALAVAAILLYFGHVLVLGVCSLAAAGIIAASAPDLRSAVRRVSPLLTPAPIAGTWILVTHRGERMVTSATLWEVRWRRLAELPGTFLGDANDEWAVLMVMSIAALAVLAGLRARATVRWFPVIATALLYFLWPERIFGTYFIYPRFAVLLLLFFFAALEPGKGIIRPALARKLLALLIIAWMAILTSRFRIFGRDARDFDTLLAHMEPNKRVVSLIFVRTSTAVWGVPFLHFPAYYQAEKGGVLGFSFAGFFPELVRYRPGRAPVMTEGLEWVPARFNWKNDGHYDYFVVRSVSDLSAKLFAEASSPVTLEAHAGMWWLYRRTPQ